MKWNPCEQAWFANLWLWLATDCWCCSGFRAILAIGLPALLIGYLLPRSELLWAFLLAAAIAGVAIVAIVALKDEGTET